MLHIAFLERKNQKKRFFLSKSMPNFNFAKVHSGIVVPAAADGAFRSHRGMRILPCWN